MHLRVNGMQVRNVTLRRGEKRLELVIADPLLGEFVADDGATLLFNCLHAEGLDSF